LRRQVEDQPVLGPHAPLARLAQQPLLPVRLENLRQPLAGGNAALARLVVKDARGEVRVQPGARLLRGRELQHRIQAPELKLRFEPGLGPARRRQPQFLVALQRAAQGGVALGKINQDHPGDKLLGLARDKQHPGEDGPEKKRIQNDGNDDAVQDNGLFAEGRPHFAAIEDRHVAPVYAPQLPERCQAAGCHLLFTRFQPL